MKIKFSSSVINDLHNIGVEGIENFIKIVGRSPNPYEEKNLEKTISARVLSKIETEILDKIDDAKSFSGSFTGFRRALIAHYNVVFCLINDTITILHISPM